MRSLLTQGLTSSSQRSLSTAGLGLLDAAVFVELQFCLLELRMAIAPQLVMSLLAVPATDLVLRDSAELTLSLAPLPQAILTAIASPELRLTLRSCCNER